MHEAHQCRTGGAINQKSTQKIHNIKTQPTRIAQPITKTSAATTLIVTSQIQRIRTVVLSQ